MGQKAALFAAEGRSGYMTTIAGARGSTVRTTRCPGGGGDSERSFPAEWISGPQRRDRRDRGLRHAAHRHDWPHPAGGGRQRFARLRRSMRDQLQPTCHWHSANGASTLIAARSRRKEDGKEGGGTHTSAPLFRCGRRRLRYRQMRSHGARVERRGPGGRRAGRDRQHSRAPAGRRAGCRGSRHRTSRGSAGRGVQRHDDNSSAHSRLKTNCCAATLSWR